MSHENHHLSERLPREVEVPASLRQILVWILGALATVAVINFAFFIGLERWPRQRAVVSLEKKWNLLKNANPPPDVIFIGDSSCDTSVDPDTIERTSGLTSINACSVRVASVANNTWMMSWYLENVGKPDAFVLLQMYQVWKADPVVDAMLWSIPGGRDSWWREPFVDLNLTEKLSARFGRYAPLYSQNLTIAGLLMEPWKLASPPKMLWRDNGFMAVTHDIPSQIVSDTANHLDYLKKERFEASEWSQKSMAEMVRLANEHQVHVYLAQTPIVDTIYSTPEYQAYLAELNAWLESYASQSPYVHVLTTDAFPRPAEQMENVAHVYAEGAEAFSESLGQTLAREAATSGTMRPGP